MLGGGATPPQDHLSAQDPLPLLSRAAVADEPQAEQLRRQAGRLLPAWKQTAGAADLARLAQRLTQTIRTPAALRQVLGPPARVARQLLHRRHLEQWTFDGPGALCVVWDFPRGLEPRLAAVHVLGLEKN